MITERFDFQDNKIDFTINNKQDEINTQNDNYLFAILTQRIMRIVASVFSGFAALGGQILHILKKVQPAAPTPSIPQEINASNRAFGAPLQAPFGKSVQSPSFLIEGNSRAGREDVEIVIPIAKCSHLSLTESNLKDIFKLANQYTLNTPYAVENTSKRIGGKMVHRPNHNGTHSARQVGYLEAMFDLIENKGLPQAQQQLNQLTLDEKLNLKLAAYFLRAGRVDESSHKKPPTDDYYTRSALIYEAYAKQLGVDSAQIEWIKKLIIDSCKPMSLCQEVNKNEKSKFAYDLLTTAHELDLVRCFDENKILQNMQGTQKRLAGLITDPDIHVKRLYDFAKTLCEATGCSRKVDNHPGNQPLFALCSTNGDVCWQAILDELPYFIID